MCHLDLSPITAEKEPFSFTYIVVLIYSINAVQRPLYGVIFMRPYDEYVINIIIQHSSFRTINFKICYSKASMQMIVKPRGKG